MTNQEHWEKAKDQAAQRYGYKDFKEAFDDFGPTDTGKILYTEAAELMAQSIRDEYEIKQAGLEHTISIYESSQDDWKGIVAKKNKEIERLKQLISQGAEH